jgi:hypothetical protein
MERFPGVGSDFEPGAEDAGDAGCARRRDAAGDMPASPPWAAWITDNGWLPASQPPASPRGEQFPVQVVGLIDDPRLRINGDEPFWDTVSWWPARKCWTVTHVCRADADSVADFPVRVRAWHPIELPPPESDLWKGSLS